MKNLINKIGLLIYILGVFSFIAFYIFFGIGMLIHMFYKEMPDITNKILATTFILSFPLVIIGYIIYRLTNK